MQHYPLWHASRVRAIRQDIDDYLHKHPELLVPETDWKKTRKLRWPMHRRKHNRQFATHLHSVSSAPTMANDANRTDKIDQYKCTTARVEVV